MNITQPSTASLELPSALAGEDRPDDVSTPAYARDPLWARITKFALDDPRSELPFSQRLARENGWSRHFAIRVIGEYKRFCYLARRAGHGVTPSDEVDQAWHLHLLYTKATGTISAAECWGVPCTTARPAAARTKAPSSTFHTKTPSRPDRRAFGSEPPPDIWPAVEARFTNAGAFRRVDTASYWLLPKPSLASFWSPLKRSRVHEILRRGRAAAFTSIGHYVRCWCEPDDIASIVGRIGGATPAKTPP